MARSQPLVRYPAEKIVEAYEHALDSDTETVLIVVSGLVRSLTARRLSQDTLEHDYIYEVLEHDNPELIKAWELMRVRMTLALDDDSSVLFSCDRTLGDLTPDGANHIRARNPAINLLTTYTALGGISKFVATRHSLVDVQTGLIEGDTATVSVDITQGDHVIVTGIPRPTALTSSTTHNNTTFVRSTWSFITRRSSRTAIPDRPFLKLVK